MTTHCVNLKPEMHVKPLLNGAMVLVLPSKVQPDKRWGKAASALLQCACPYKPGDTLIGRETWRWTNVTVWEYKADVARPSRRSRLQSQWLSAPTMPMHVVRWRLKVKSIRPMPFTALTTRDFRKMGLESSEGTESSRSSRAFHLRCGYQMDLEYRWQQDYPKLPFDTAWVWRIEVER